MTQAITRSVWSFWTKPFHAHRQSVWLSEKYHLFAWVLSVETARKHYPETVLVTDNAGAEMLVDGIGLEFSSVAIELNALDEQDPDWWVSGKLWAYRSQTKPFIHVDADVFLWKPLPEKLISAPVIAQNPEYFVFGKHDATCWWYRPEVFDQRVRAVNGWLPEEWDWYIANRTEVAYCCGILGGNQVSFLNHYADLALQIATHPRNQEAFSLMENKPGDCLLIEQYFLAACLEYHKQYADSQFQGVEIECLFESVEAAFFSDEPEKVGYTHLIGPTKHNQEIVERLEKRVANDYPVQYERCLRYLNRINFLPAATGLTNLPSPKGDLHQASLTLSENEKTNALVVADTTIVDNEALVSLFSQLSSALRDRLARQALFVDIAPSDTDKFLVYFALQDIFQVCLIGIVQARTNKINDADAIQILLTLAEVQEKFLTTLDQHDNRLDNEKNSFISGYRHYLSLFRNEAVNNNLMNIYLTQRDINNWLNCRATNSLTVATN